ncbi:tetratricopeptide repeat protein [Candidatus Leptofilum sp.]|uniref:tetratricopeptide repeat protein n=1 Tax=Candidatus Leptofilum sp. TaxID=3241576 RepID=UPI003B5B1D19
MPTNIATATATPTQLPTMTPTSEGFLRFEPSPDGHPYPEIPLVEMDVSKYRLTTPDTTILFQVLLATMKETCNYDHETQYRAEYAFGDLFRMLKFEYDKLTEEELEKTAWLIQDTDNCLGEGFSHYIPAIIPQALQIGTVNFLNQNKIRFEPLVQSSPEIGFQAIPIDYDPLLTEWLIEATFSRYDLRIFVPIYEDNLGTYHLIPNEFTPQQIRSLFGRELRPGIDLTGDGVNEIIIVARIDGSTAVGHPGFIEIFSWDEGFIKTFDTLWIGDARVFSAAFDTDYTIADFNNDSVPDIQVIKPHYDFDFPNCNWLEKHLYSWQGTEVNSTIEFLEEPNRSECLALDIEYAGSSLLIDGNFLIDSYVINDSATFTYDETGDSLRGFVSNHAHIMQWHTLAGHDLDYLQEVLQRTLDRMDSEQSFYQPSHLRYLLGLSFELNGEEETAVATYLDLIQQYPTSPWSWLAWARLEPMPDEP